MNSGRLRYMADQIARNFAAGGEAAAIAATAEHIRLFWDPRMKAAILADDRNALSPVAAAAVDRLAGQGAWHGSAPDSSCASKADG
ncbi:MAG: formate dehydrogenase subunit delta [Novosphingobium sp.]|jgi:formate dehydrogenase subunit delta|nr:formate dehydrogenase subunit delta [Novosphingobium sp.]